MVERAGGEVMGQALDIVGSAPGIDGVTKMRLASKEKLGVARDAGREIGRQGERFI